MTKLIFEAQGTRRLVTKLDDTIEILKKIERKIASTGVPYDFSSSLYSEATRDVKKVANGLANISNDLTRAYSNFEETSISCQKNNNNFVSDFKIELDEPIIKVD